VCRVLRRGRRLRERSGRLYAFKAAGRHANRHSASRTTILTKSRQRRLPPRLTCPVCLVCPVPPRKNHRNAFVQAPVRALRRSHFILTAPLAEKDFSRHATRLPSRTGVPLTLRCPPSMKTRCGSLVVARSIPPRKFQYRGTADRPWRNGCNCSPSSRRSRAEPKRKLVNA